MSQELHAHTPILSVVDNRGLPVRIIACHRLATTDMPELRVTRNAYDPAGRRTTSQDPRLLTPNQLSVHSLSGQVLSTNSVDAGWRVTLLGEAGQVLEGWDGRGTQRQVEYDEVLRPVLIRETAAPRGTGFSREEVGPVSDNGSSEMPPSRLKPVPHATPDQDSQAQIVECFTYGGPQSAEHNQCNQLTRHDDTAGTLHHPDYGLLGSPLTEVRHFLRELDMPDWPADFAERDALLETDGLESSWAFNALGEEIRQTDAMLNSRHFKHTVAGQLKSVALGEQILLHDIRYNAFDQVEQQTAGNGVVSGSSYDPQDGRLIELRAGLSGAPPLQLLTYSYDPVGNIEQIEDAAQPVRFFANQRIDPINRYRYDTLYQLIEATGREVRTDASHGPALPDLQNLPPDPNQLANYTQTYDYDAGGNLLAMHHLGAQPFNRLMRVALNSNRSLPADEVDVDFEDGCDANGNLLQLVRGQALIWDARNQLRRITTVQREDGTSDDETYVYDGAGQRCRKVSSAQTQNRILINEVRYLPGLEIRSNADGEILHVITVNNERLLHWPAGTHSDQLRYSLSDHLGSNTLELDHQGGLISQESYYPFGGTSWWAARSVVEAKYKTVRYSGKERDTSGLYYYGYRYYAPWLQRWINPDPSGIVYGLNMFSFVDNNPILHADKNGNFYEGQDDRFENAITSEGILILARGLENFPAQHNVAVLSALDTTISYLQSALKMSTAYPDKFAATMRAYFGYEHASVTTDIINTWHSTLDLANEYRSQSGAKKFVLIDNDRSNALVMPEDPYGRIFLNINALHKPTFPITLGHEISHLKVVNGMTSTGTETMDYYFLFPEGFEYMTEGLRTPEGHNGHPVLGTIVESSLDPQMPYRNTSELLVGGGFNARYLSSAPELNQGFFEAINLYASELKLVSTAENPINTFNKNPKIIAKISSRNADSLIYAACDLHIQHQRLTGQRK